MIIEKMIFCLLVMMMYNTLFGQPQTNSARVITDRKLDWDDFSGSVDQRSDFDAMTYWGVRYSYRTKVSTSDTLQASFIVEPLFMPASWVKKYRKSGELLRHEQGHYDLAIICAEMLKENFAKGIYLKENYQTAIDSIYRSTMLLVRQIEEQYDAETNHMLNRDEQNRWNQNIAALLAKIPNVYKER